MDKKVKQALESVVEDLKTPIPDESPTEESTVEEKKSAPKKVVKKAPVKTAAKKASYVPSPIAVGKYFYMISDLGSLSCFDGESGKRDIAGVHGRAEWDAGERAV